MQASFSFIPSSSFAGRGKDKGKGKSSAHQAPVKTPASPFLSGSSSSSDNDDEFYFSDVSSASSRLSRSSSSSSGHSHTLGDFVFENDEDYEDYFSVVTASTSRPSPCNSEISSSLSPPAPTNPKRSAKTRKGSSAFFLSGSILSSGMPAPPPSVAAENPALRRSPDTFSKKMGPLASLGSDTEQYAQGRDTDSQFERALLFARWQQTEGVWQAPAGTSGNLVKLVALAI